MFFGATPFSATTFAGVGAQNAIILATGNRLNVSIGNATAGIKFPAVVTGNRLMLQLVVFLWYLGMMWIQMRQEYGYQ